MFGVPEPPRFEGVVLVISWLFGAALVVGAFTAMRWPLARARLIRRVTAAVAVLVQLAFHIGAPARSPVESAGRFVFLWPATIIGLIAMAVWEWRDGRRMRRAA